MKNSNKTIAITLSPASAYLRLLYMLMAILVVSIMMGCNTQKTTTEADQRPSAQRGERSGRPSVDEIFAMDANQDGKLAKSELEGPLLRDFSKIDSDGDGFITRLELENAPQPQRGQGPPRGGH